MKNGKLNHDPHQRKPIVSHSSKPSDLKLPQTKPKSAQGPAPKATKENPDSKTSTQDLSHKLDSSQAKMKDISHIVSESLLCDEQCPENNISEISIINMLGDGNIKGFNQEPLNFDCIEDNEILKRELEMKNRLIEKLMKENADLREEMESFLTSMEQAKDHLNNSVQDCHHKISELEHKVTQLDTENKSLKEQLSRKAEEESLRENRMHDFEKKTQQYCDYTKNSMEEFYLRLNQQMLSFIDTSRRQHDAFSRTVRDGAEDIREEILFGNKLSELKIVHSASVPSSKVDKRGMEGSFDENIMRENVMSQSMGLHTPRNSSDTGLKGNASTGKKSGVEGSKSRANLNSCARIDEGPEYKLERRSSLAVGKGAGALKKNDNKENIPVGHKGMKPSMSVRDLPMTKSVVKGRVSMGAISGDKKGGL